MGLKQARWYAEVRKAKPLEKFVNLARGDLRRPVANRMVQEFRKRYPRFVPDGWWDVKIQSTVPTVSLWRANQGMLREAWAKQFKIDQFEFMKLLLSVYDPEVVSQFHTQMPIWTDIFGVDTNNDYWRAVTWLRAESWRARKCAWEGCDRYFIASHPKVLCCTSEHTRKRRNKQKLDQWLKHPEWNENRKHVQ